MKITTNGNYPYEYVAPKLQILMKGKKYTLGEIEVDVPPQIVEIIKEVPVNPTKELCESLYPDVPTPPTPPTPPIPPIPPIPPTDSEPQPDWDAGWPMIEGGASALYDRNKYPSITKGNYPNSDRDRAYGLVFKQDAEVEWAAFNSIGPYAEDDYGYSLVPPLFEVERFYNYYTKWVPHGLPNGPRNSMEEAFLAHSMLRFHIGNCCSWYCYGKVSWSPELPHGFNLVIAYDGADIYDWKLYFYDVSMGIPVTLVKKEDAYRLINFFAYDAG